MSKEIYVAVNGKDTHPGTKARPFATLTRARDANDATLPPTFVATFQRLAHNVDVANALKAIVHAAACHLDQMIHHIVDFAGVNEVCHPELGRQRLLIRVQIDTNDASSAHQFGALNDIESDAPKAKYRDGGAGLNFHRERDRANPGCDAAADVTNFVEGRILAHFGDGYLGQNRKIRKGRTAHVMK